MPTLVPAYFSPAGGAWNPLYNAIDNAPKSFFQVIVNPSNGPGGFPGSLPSVEYQQALAEINRRNITRTYGYVTLNAGSRPIDEVRRDIDTYAGWPADIQSNVKGIYFDQAPAASDDAAKDYARQISEYAKATLPASRVIYNPGVAVDATFYSFADYVVAFDGPYSQWDFNKTLDSLPAEGRTRNTAVLIRDFPVDGKEVQDQICSDLFYAAFGAASITTRAGFDGFSELWVPFWQKLSQLAASVAPAAVRRAVEWTS